MTIERDLTRRGVLRTAGTAGAVALTAAACGGTPESAATSGGAASAGPTVEAGIALAAVQDVPVGGGVILVKPKVVVTQPTVGQFAAFSSVCTHAGCPVTEVKNGFMVCPCHGSRFSVATGEPTADSVAKTALAPTPVKVVDGKIVRA